MPLKASDPTNHLEIKISLTKVIELLITAQQNASFY